jgi:peptidoglycan/LPS O-acetylase OafA/YrhL
LANRLLSWLGLISYGIFLWHFSLAAWLYNVREPGDDGPGPTFLHHLSHFKMLAFFGATLALCCIVASASYYGVELRFLKLKERRLRFSFRRAPAAARSS